MSKIGNKPIEVPQSVTVTISESDKSVQIKGKIGELSYKLPNKLNISREDNKLIVKRSSEDKKTKSLHGLYRSLLNNAIIGVDTPWTKRLEVVGTGFNVKMQGQDLVFKLGFSHPVVFKSTTGVNFVVDGNNKVIISGADKQLVGQVAYQIKSAKKPDPYKGKGIRYEGEQLKLKPGKKAKTEAA